ncbi:MAG TPA: hypothetical protein VFQ39_12905, partial [Longimicrobium sp.]|nr:hypothetical protein [Longimicrobium sp.]
PGGSFQQVYAGAGARLDVLPARVNGWPSLMSIGHMSAAEAVYRRSEFDGRRYRWRDVEYRERERGRADVVRYHLTRTERAGRARTVLDPMRAGGGLWLSATADRCAPGAARACSTTRLELQSATLPAGRVCVRYRSEEGEGPVYQSAAGDRWCGVTTPVTLPGGGQGRRLVVTPARRDLERMANGYDAHLIGPGLPGKLDLDAVGALLAFAGSLEESRN